MVAAVGSIILALPLSIAAASPGINSADILAVACPIVFIAAAWPLIPKGTS